LREPVGADAFDELDSTIKTARLRRLENAFAPAPCRVKRTHEALAMNIA
jgi:hypothetical protein